MTDDDFAHLPYDSQNGFGNETSQISSDAHYPAASISAHDTGGAQDSSVVLTDLCARIRGYHRHRQDLHDAEKRLDLQIQSIYRRFRRAVYLASGQGQSGAHAWDAPEFLTDTQIALRIADEQKAEADVLADSHTLSMREGKDTIHAARLVPEKNMKKLARELPVWAWTESINGMGELGLAQIIAETGDLCNYTNPAKVWKRMGLAVINGKSQRRVKGEGALEQGYSPRRRAIMFVIGDSMIKKQNLYRELYLKRKAYEEMKLPDSTKMHWHRRAQRWMEKRLLSDLWRQWMCATGHADRVVEWQKYQPRES